MSAAEQALVSGDAVPSRFGARRLPAWSRATVFGCSCYRTSSYSLRSLPRTLCFRRNGRRSNGRRPIR